MEKCSGLQAKREKTYRYQESAWAQNQRLVLAQRKVEGKSNEKTAIPDLLDSLDLQDALVSINAIGCSEKIARSMINKGGYYLLSLKNNQKSFMIR